MTQGFTKPTKLSEIKQSWHLVDVKNGTIGREASKIANLLMGKSKPYFIKNLDCGDFVVVINAKDVKATGKKETVKTYYRHSGYPGGQKAERLEELRARRPEEIIVHAVKGMLPQNKLRAKMLARLFVFADENHTYADKLAKK